mmetsp:Transcript_11489/g.20929  ORF Transcript_11489/g.20929 Transcript_11489/m.20929 type:complete len:413 (-) Transcript_11489:78-1316(-)
MACAFNCLGAGSCLYSTAASCTINVLLSSNTTSDLSLGYTFDDEVASTLGWSECGCRCTSADTSSTGSFYSDPRELSANCGIWSPLADALSVANVIAAVFGACYAFRTVVNCLFNDGQIFDRSPRGHFTQFILHNRAFFFSLHVIIWTLVLLLDKEKHLDKDKGLAISRIIIGFQVMGSTISVVYLWTKLLPLKIMKGEPIVKLIRFVETNKGRIEMIVLVMFFTAAIFVMMDDFSSAVKIWNVSISLICPFPMYFIAAISTNLYKKMHPDQNTVGKMNSIQAFIALFNRGATAEKEQPELGLAKFKAVVFKLRLSCAVVLFIGSGAITVALGLAFVPVVQALPDYFDKLLIFCALGFFASMEFIFSPVRFAKAKQEAQKTSEHHASTVEETESTESADEKKGNGSSKVAPA